MCATINEQANRPTSSRLSEPLESPGAIGWLRHPRVLALVLAVGTFLAFSPTLRHDFVNYDDPEYVTANPQVRLGLTWENIRWAFTTVHAVNWHPVTWLSHLVDVQLFGLRPLGHHLRNVLLHTLNVVLLFGLLRKMTSATRLSFIVAALFALHPLHVESVAWVAERKDLLSGCFFLLSLWAYGRYTDQKACRERSPVPTGLAPTPDQQQAGAAITIFGQEKRTGFRPPKPWLPYLAAWLLFVLGLMSKPMLVTLPFVLLLLDVWPLRRLKLDSGELTVSTHAHPSAQYPLSLLLLEKTPFFLASLAACVVTFLVQRAGTAVQSLATIPLGLRVENALVSYGKYVGKTVWPFDLATPYPYLGHYGGILVGLLVAALIASLVGVWLLRTRSPYLAVGWLWFLGMLAPVSGLVQVGNQSMADRYMYLPMVGLLIVLTWGGAAVLARWRFPQAGVGLGVGVVLLGCGWRTWDQERYWQDSVSLFSHAIRVSQKNWVASYNLGCSLSEGGHPKEAVPYFRKTVELQPKYYEGWNNLGCALSALKQYSDAVPCFQTALRLSPDNAEARRNLASALSQLGRGQDTIASWRERLASQPHDLQALNGLGNALVDQGQYAQALPYFEQSLRLNANQTDAHCGLGNALAKLRRLDEALSHYEAALREKPDLAEVHYDAAIALARQGKMEQAISHLRAAVRLLPQNLTIRCALAKALIAQQSWDEVISLCQDILQTAPENTKAHAYLGLALASRGRPAEAIPHLQAALRQASDDPALHFNLGKAFAAIKKPDQAKLHFSEALRLRPDYTLARQELQALQMQTREAGR